MRRILARRGLQSLAVALGIGLLAFVISRLLPGDAAATWAGPRASLEELARVREMLGLDKPLPEQAVRYLADLVTLNWGVSIRTRQPVLEDVLGRFMTSFELVVFAMLLAGLVGIPLGVMAARWKGKPPDWLAGLTSSVLVAIPVFWYALVLQLVLATKLDWLPVAGRWDQDLNEVAQASTVTHMVIVDSLLAGNVDLLLSGLSHMILPALVIAAYPMG
ncbi:MAG: binding-protein-dependent transport system inner rane component, partial [Chloroflexi bacterium]|nr:binding-protein-dependent transport system inner rane component [Chloroflexota bacterium]